MTAERVDRAYGALAGISYDFMEDVPALTGLATAAAAMADSYRVKVGAVLVAEDPRSGQVSAFVGANSKPTRLIRKQCAEMRALADARAAGATLVWGLVVAGPSDESVIASITERPTPTLHPCGDCCYTMDFYQQEGDLRLPDSLPVVTVGREKGDYQVYSLEELMLLHGHRPADIIGMPPEHIVKDTGFQGWRQALQLPRLQAPPAPAMRQALQLVGAAYSS